MKFLEQTAYFKYGPNEFSKGSFQSLEEISLIHPNEVVWLNTIGLEHQVEMRHLIERHKLEPFLIKLLKDEDQSNKVIPMQDLLFLSINVLQADRMDLETEQMFFIVSPDFVWTIQEVADDHFHWIRDRIEDNSGIIRQKKGDYLLFLLLESIISNYQSTFDRIYSDPKFENLSHKEVGKPAFTAELEERKQQLFKVKKAVSSLRDTLLKCENATLTSLSISYFSELKEQSINLMNDIDFELYKMDSTTNLIFSVQGHRLNEIMKTLTIFSVIFIPLTFMAGIYGMNFENMPELSWRNGYFFLLGVMLLVGCVSVWIMKRNKWF
ncbi:CorA family divalent cation transporter [Aureitalea marina]|uniref:Divalent cation transporter n=1 Tax=Aureitalea marina TaxID=930804 RepID=A0A2S7KS09_9FLAO|nr:CorA family divalent cation transporter [Aureitalea marina]PQB05387.1 divalent cation transporter [Aureitalea marina]